MGLVGAWPQSGPTGRPLPPCTPSRPSIGRGRSCSLNASVYPEEEVCLILLFITRYMGPVGPWQRPCRRPLVAQRRAFLINLLLPRTSLRSHSGVSHGSFSPNPPTEEEVSGEVPRQCLVYQRCSGPSADGLGPRLALNNTDSAQCRTTRSTWTG